MSRRTWIALVVSLVLIGGYFSVMAWIRAHVDDLIQQSVDAPLPEFRLTDRSGRTWSREDLLGKRAVLHFFRSHCAACEVEAPAIRELEQEAPDDVVWLHVMTDVVLDVEPATTEATIARKKYARPVLMADAEFVDAFHSATFAQVTPVTYVVDASCVVRYGLRGRQTVESVRRALDAVAN